MTIKPKIASRKSGVSSTAVSVIGNRWMMHVFGTRKDPNSAALFKILPNSPIFGMWLLMFPRFAVSKLSKGKYPSINIRHHDHASLINVGPVREKCVDFLINKSLGSVSQVVNLGAGYDTRFYSEMFQNVNKNFELDTSATINYKKVWLESAGIATDNVKFVETDFTSEMWFRSLIDAGFHTRQKTLFLWQGVNLYISEKDVRTTLSIISKNSPAGSIIISDFYDLNKIGGMRSIQTKTERFTFGLDFSHNDPNSLRAFVESENLRLGECYLMGCKSRSGTFGAVAEVHIW
jgi:methyltransferase (TIGR00027 family)